jgi:hypothetical protein
VPFLRVVRDKRGYETTYLMHWYREGHRQRSRILYVFRTPGGVRVGREPFEPETLRRIESQHPDIAFDWAVVRENQQIVEPAGDQRRRRPKREDEAVAPSAPAPPPVSPASHTAAPPLPPIPSSVQGATPDEQIAFLVEWYPAVKQRIALRTSDPVRLEMLLALVERLNPTAWTDADQITTGLQNAAEALERLSHVLSRRRRRSRRKSGRVGPGVDSPGALGTSEESAEESDALDGETDTSEAEGADS